MSDKKSSSEINEDSASPLKDLMVKAGLVALPIFLLAALFVQLVGQKIFEKIDPDSNIAKYGTIDPPVIVHVPKRSPESEPELIENNDEKETLVSTFTPEFRSVLGATIRNLGASGRVEFLKELNPNETARKAHLAGMQFFRKRAEKRYEGMKIPTLYDPRVALDSAIAYLANEKISNRDAILMALVEIDGFCNRTAAVALIGKESQPKELTEAERKAIDDSLEDFNEFVIGLDKLFGAVDDKKRFDKEKIRRDIEVAVAKIESCCDRSRVASYHLFTLWNSYALTKEGRDNIDRFLENLKRERLFTDSVREVAERQELKDHLTNVISSVERRIDTNQAFQNEDVGTLSQIVEDARKESAWFHGPSPEEFDPRDLI